MGNVARKNVIENFNWKKNVTEMLNVYIAYNKDDSKI